MSRSNYSDDGEDQWGLIRWRGQVASSIRGKRGQALLIETLAALDAMPNKVLIASELTFNGEFCTLGVVGQARGIPLADIDPEAIDCVAKLFDVAEPLVREIVYENDECGRWDETPQHRWTRMRQWVAGKIKVVGADMTDKLLHILQHSLGVGEYGDKPNHRNYFVTGKGSDDFDNCMKLVDQGLMQLRPMNKSLTGGDDCFVVTPKGVDYVALNSPTRPKLSRSKQRYQDYRRSEYNGSFAEYLGVAR